jgi:hypothetical protein
MEGEGREWGKEPSSSLYTLRYAKAQEDSEGWRGKKWSQEPSSSLYTLRYAPQVLKDAEGWRGRGGSGARSPLVPSTLLGMHKLRQKDRGGGWCKEPSSSLYTLRYAPQDLWRIQKDGGGGARSPLVPFTLSGMHKLSRMQKGGGGRNGARSPAL